MIMAEEKSEWALASPLGGTGFGMAVWTVGFAFSGLIPVGAGLASAAVNLLWFAGFAQFIAAIIEFRRGSHALGYTHGSYGIFGLATGFMFYTTLGTGTFTFPVAAAMAWYWIGWALISVILAVTTIPVSKMFSVDLWWLAIVFVLFAAGSYSILITHIAAWMLIAMALYTWYIVAAFSINTSFGKNIVPVK
jgi:succinate-acetate transporter protein